LKIDNFIFTIRYNKRVVSHKDIQFINNLNFSIMKKNLFWLAGIAVMLTACENKMDDETAVSNETKTVTFSVQGDFEKPTFEGMTRAGLEADGKAMTDLWVLDYQNGTLLQQVHQTAEDADFGSPSLALGYGAHHVYFVTSRGTTPTLLTDAHKITWAKAMDTFYKDYSINVASSTSATQSVTLDRVATKLSVTVNDEIPEGISSIELTPATWYSGLDYISGQPTDALTNEARVISIPASYVGRTETNLSIYGISSTTEWTTDVTVTARDGDGNVLGQAELDDAPFVANRVTSYSGNLFSSGGGFALSLNAEWGTEYTGSW